MAGRRARKAYGLTKLAAVLAAAIIAAGWIALSPTAASAQRKECVDCHADFKKRLKEGTVHAPAKESCETCHKRHGFAQKLILQKDPPDLCTDCHEKVKTEMSAGNVHQALSQGGCTVCHDPHSSKEKALMRTPEAGSSVCLSCHGELGELMKDKNAHSPFVKGDCSACHAPHASSNPKLLVASEVQVCAACHEDAPAKHKMPGFAGTSCSDCHDPHVASKKQPLASAAHAPYAGGECDACHSIEAGEVAIGDGFPPADLCAGCHDDEAGRVAGAKSHFGSATLKSGGSVTCLECHAPHKSENKPLLTKAEGDLCRTCHEKLPPKDSQEGSTHPPFAGGQCTECHQPHGGGEAHQLVKTGPALCSSCHEKITTAAAGGAAKHKALQTAECLDCHVAHASKQWGLLKEDMATTCGTCHEKKEFAAPHPPYEKSECESCHQNHSENPKLLIAGINETCSPCHEDKAKAINAAFGHAPAKEENCLFCHAPHGSQNRGMLQSEQKDLCGGCHDVKDLVAKTAGADQNKPAAQAKLHKPLADGRCSACHDAHGSATKGLLVRAGENLCYGCHTQEHNEFAKGKVHKPVAEGRCDTCHNPHGSTGDGLAKMAEPDLCIQCHAATDPVFTKGHRGFDVTQARCTACHAPHSSEKDNLLNPYIHAPFAEGSCDACHEETKTEAGLTKVSAAVPADVCFTCHDEKRGEKGHQHAAGVACTDCHNPHASTDKSLLKNPSRLCQSCHEDVLKVASSDGRPAILHKPIENEGCRGCHKLHSPAADGFLAQAQGELCSSCHASIKTQQKDKAKHAPFAKGSCSECHATHASTDRHLLKTDLRQLCTTCHKLSGEKMAAAHRKIPLTGAGCTTCHAPHSTSGKLPTLVYSNAHAPYKEGNCGSCHDSSGKPKKEAAACFECHEAKGFASVHNAGRSGAQAAEMGVCLDCHSPHAGYDNLFVRTPEIATCIGCHDRKEFTRKTVHGALESGCETCHDLHKNNIEELKGPKVQELCVGCHENAMQHAHPLGTQYKDPRNNRPLTCMSCHEAHSSEFETMVPFDPKRDLCMQCHTPGLLKAH